ncbi:class I SAM-dependent methyltransferase [Streptomyces tendae]|uniref:class I SAM-dependent methyltransferase n=1 Tax=Streptomyces tendae TaxID=1932 RepID=UPI003D74847F
MNTTSKSHNERLLDPVGEEYSRAFALFLSGTDQKTVTQTYLSQIIAEMPRRDVFLDIGAGEGGTTEYIGRHFRKVVAIEPSAHMCKALHRALPDAVVLSEPVETVQVDVKADLALCAHVLYHLPHASWTATIRRMLDWVVPGGELVVTLQNPDDDAMRMSRYASGRLPFSLADLAVLLEREDSLGIADSGMETLKATYRSPSRDDTLTVAQFMLGVPELTPANRQRLAEYVDQNFSAPDGSFKIGHSQDVLRLRKAQ